MAAGRQPTFNPIWSRDALPDPTPTRSGGTPPSPPIFEPIPPAVEYVTDFSHDQIGRVRDRFFNETGTNCSTFDVVTAKLWQSRVRAIGPEPAVAVTLCSPVDMRRLLIEDMLKLEGDYYGSCGYSLVVSERSDRIAGAASLVEVVGLVKEAKERMPGRLSTWLEGDPQENPFNVASVDYGLTHMVDWRWIGFGEVDFGSGTPDSVAPLNGFEGCNFLLRSPLPKKGVRLMTNSIAREHVEAFRNEMKDLF